MDIVHLVITLIAVLAIIAISHPLSALTRLPHSFVLLAGGFFISEFLVAREVDIGIDWHNFHDLIFYVFLPVVVFEAAFRLDIAKFVEHLGSVLFLAVPAMLLAVFIMAGILFYLIGYPSAFPWAAALLAAVILAPTDPTAVMSILTRGGFSERVQMVLEGESLLNDATAITMFAVVIEIAMLLSTGGATLSWGGIVFGFFLIFLGGFVVGAVIAVPLCLVLKKLPGAVMRGVITLIAAYSSFLIADHWLNLSGIMSTLACGLIIGGYLRRDVPDEEQIGVTDSLWEFLASLSEAMIFLLAGVTFTYGMFSTHWLAMLIGILAVIVARITMIYGSFSIFNLLRKDRDRRVPAGEQHLMALGGVRGAITLALALSLPLELEYWYIVQSIAYGVVLFTLITSPMGLRWLARGA